MNCDSLLWGITLRRGYLSGWLPSSLSKGCRDELRSAELACQALRRIRTHYKLSQSETATLLGSSVATVQAWEAGRRKPSGLARVLILLVEQALEHWPPGEWREIWGFPLTYIIAARKLEKDKETEREFWSKFAGFSVEEKKTIVVKWEGDLSRMRELAGEKCLVQKVETVPSESERAGEVTGPCCPTDETRREWQAVLEYERIRQLAR